MKNKIVQNIKIIILALVLAVGAGYAYAEWNVAPSDGPANASTNNAPAPINVGPQFQTKVGGASGIGMPNLIVSKSFQFATGTPTAGSVLVATDSSGNAAWGTASGAANYGYDTQCQTFMTLTGGQTGGRNYQPICVRINKTTGAVTAMVYGSNSGATAVGWNGPYAAPLTVTGTAPFNLYFGPLVYGYNTTVNQENTIMGVCVTNSAGNTKCINGDYENIDGGVSTIPFKYWSSFPSPF